MMDKHIALVIGIVLLIVLWAALSLANAWRRVDRVLTDPLPPFDQACVTHIEGSLRHAIDQKVRETLDLLDGYAVPNGDGWSSTMTMVAVLCSIGGLSVGWLLAMAFDAAGLR